MAYRHSLDAHDGFCDLITFLTEFYQNIPDVHCERIARTPSLGEFANSGGQGYFASLRELHEKLPVHMQGIICATEIRMSDQISFFGSANSGR